MKLERGFIKRASLATKYTSGIICAALKGKKRMPFKVAEFIEEEKGIDCRSWYWPHKYPNPILQDVGHEAAEA